MWYTGRRGAGGVSFAATTHSYNGLDPTVFFRKAKLAMIVEADPINDYVELNYPDQDILLADGFEDAFLGIVESMGSQPKALYDENKCIDILEERDGMDYEEAVEYFRFNMTGAYVGEFTPAFISLFEKPCDPQKELPIKKEE